jgi:organic hydroperoxide reductase OsmC/OhrA
MGKRAGLLNGDGLPDLTIGSPPEFGGEAGMWTPEHFFVAAANACLMSTFLAMAGFSKLEIHDWSSRATGTLEKVEGQGWMFTSIEIEASVEVARPSDIERALRLLQKAEQGCLVSRSMKTPVSVRGQVTARELAPSSV